MPHIPIHNTLARMCKLVIPTNKIMQNITNNLKRNTRDELALHMSIFFRQTPAEGRARAKETNRDDPSFGEAYF